MSRTAPKDRPIPRPKRPAERFRAAIDQALADGVEKDSMTLHLTLGDASDLKRDRAVAIEDISFTSGVMRFLGVKVTPGGVPTSRLDLGQDAAAETEAVSAS